VTPAPAALITTPAPLTIAFAKWADAGRAVGTGVATMLVLALASLLIDGRPLDRVGVVATLGLAVTCLVAAAGGSLSTGEAAGTVAPDAAIQPLGLTLIGLTVIAVLWLRQLRRYPEVAVAEVGRHAGRVGSLFLGALVVIVVVHLTLPGPRPPVDVAVTILRGPLRLAVAMALAVAVGLPGVLTGRFERWRATLAGPLRGGLVLMASLCVAGPLSLLTCTAVTMTGAGPWDGSTWRTQIAALLLAFPRVAAIALLFGTGVPVSATVGNTVGAYGPSGSMVSVLDGARSDPRLWLWPLLVAALLVMAGYTAARRSPMGHNGRRTALWFGAVLPVLMVVLGLSVSGPAWGGDLGPAAFPGRLDVDLVLAMLIGGVLGSGVGLLGGHLAPPEPSSTGAPTAAPAPERELPAVERE
jgi:hypothetical protein